MQNYAGGGTPPLQLRKKKLRINGALNLGDDMRFCPVCGAEIENGGMRFCPNCGKELEKNVKFCGSCGKKAEDLVKDLNLAFTYMSENKYEEAINEYY